MTGHTTSLVEADSVRSHWFAFGQFLKAPRLPAETAPLPGAAKGLLSLYVLDLAFMALLGTAAGLVIQAGFQIPPNVLDDVPLELSYIAILALGAPVLEEVLFRGWLSGKPGHIAASLLFVLAILTFAIAKGPGGYGLAIAGSLAVLLLAPVALRIWRGRKPIGWFTRYFAVIFWIETLIFGLIHTMNYQAGAAWLLAVLAIPQIWAGMLFGYARVHWGLWAAIVLHALHNGTVVAYLLLSGQGA